jgi:hypothetical protein
MGNVVNLNKFRKARTKAEKESSAKANRRKHGRTKAEKAKDGLEQEQAAAAHKANELDNPDDDEGPA